MYPLAEMQVRVAGEEEGSSLSVSEPADTLETEEDYKLLLTAAPEAAERLAAEFAARFGSPLHPIGRITAAPGLVWLRNGKPEPLEWHGFEHY